MQLHDVNLTSERQREIGTYGSTYMWAETDRHSLTHTYTHTHTHTPTHTAFIHFIYPHITFTVKCFEFNDEVSFHLLCITVQLKCTGRSLDTQPALLTRRVT